MRHEVAPEHVVVPVQASDQHSSTRELNQQNGGALAEVEHDENISSTDGKYSIMNEQAGCCSRFMSLKRRISKVLKRRRTSQ
jgi:hypothetical protein